jgi:hypothetical protein
MAQNFIRIGSYSLLAFPRRNHQKIYHLLHISKRWLMQEIPAFQTELKLIVVIDKGFTDTIGFFFKSFASLIHCFIIIIKRDL